MRCLDLFCGAGGAAVGLYRAGFEVVGVDIKPQPRYPFEFHQADALMFPLDGFDFIWASPPCQAHTAMKTMHNAKSHKTLIPEVREKLKRHGRPYIIENVPGAPLINPILLCGTMFNLGVDDAELRRHRIFESSISIVLTPECRHGSRAVIGVYGGHVRNRKRVDSLRPFPRRVIGIYGEGCRDSRRKTDRGVADFTVHQGRMAMGIPWMTLSELCQAIPPAYSEYLGKQVMNYLLSTAKEGECGRE